MNDKEQGEERKPEKTNLEVVTDFMQWGSALNQAFVIEALTRYAIEVTSNPEAVREGMKDSFISAEAWLECSEAWMKIARAKYGEK